MATAPVAARRGTILEVAREDADEDIADRPPMAREERAPEERRLSMIFISTTRTAAAAAIIYWSIFLERCCYERQWLQRLSLLLAIERHRHFDGSRKVHRKSRKKISRNLFDGCS